MTIRPTPGSPDDLALAEERAERMDFVDGMISARGLDSAGTVD